MSAHPVFWQTPQPLWARFGATTSAAARAADQARPAILRFASDDFMDQVFGTLARDPSRLDALIARPETWRSPAAAPADLVERTPVPSLVRTALRGTLALNGKGSVAATAPVATVTEGARTRERPLKLYHPAHQRFYLVGASLVCGVPGLPERAVVLGGAEQVSFVVRRLLPVPETSERTDDLREFAFVKDAAGARWQRVDGGADEGRPVAGEEMLPVFPLPFHDDADRARTMWGGLVPVGRREEYMGATVDRTAAPTFAAAQLQWVQGAPAAAPRASKQARMAQFQMEVSEPWKNLVRGSHRLRASLLEASPVEDDGETAQEKRARVYEHDLAQQQISWLVLLDLADYLEAYLPDVWAAVENGGVPAAPLSANRQSLLSWLASATMTVALERGLRATDGSAAVRPAAPSLLAALRAIRAAGIREALEATELTYTRAQPGLGSTEFPPFHFVLAGVTNLNQVDGPYRSLPASVPVAEEVEGSPLADMSDEQEAVEADAALVDRLTALVGRALEARVESDAPPLPFALQLRDALRATVGDAGWFVIRFVYTRTDCGPLHPPLLSSATQRFQLASFFDPDAPARPIRITLPLDTSPAGLRKFNRNTAFVISDMLCGQIQRAKGLGLVDLVRSVLPWPLHKALDVGSGGTCKNASGINIGMICSLSIPIITICALILLIIIVTLLDLIFRWLPFFIMCFPFPKFSGKKAAS
jgi:hypothetical protein